MTVPIDIQDEDHFEELLGEAFLRKNFTEFDCRRIQTIF